MSELSAEAQKIRKFGWKQCSLLKLENPGVFPAKEPKLPGLYLVINQTCDLQTPSLEAEPYIEIIFCKPIDVKDGNFTRGKNPRKIHIPFCTQGGKAYFECEAKNRSFTNREILTEIEPYKDLWIDENTIKEIIDWIIKRYDRHAFPDNFNSRLDRKALKKILRDCPDYVHKVLIRLSSEEELPLNRSYDIFLHLLLEDEVPESKYKLCHSILEKMIKTIEKEGKIRVISSDVLIPEQLYLSEFKTYYQLDFNDLSYPD